MNCKLNYAAVELKGTIVFVSWMQLLIAGRSNVIVFCWMYPMPLLMRPRPEMLRIVN